jgi:hypothetical protein
VSDKRFSDYHARRAAPLLASCATARPFPSAFHPLAGSPRAT